MAKGDFWADVETKKYDTALRLLGRDAFPDTVALMLNRTADAVTNEALRNVNQRLIVRTKFTTNSLTNKRASPYAALNKAMGNNVDRMFSRAGSFSPYLAVQDEGGTVTAEGTRIPIPTIAARSSNSLRKAIARRYRMDRIGDVGTAQAEGGYNRFFIGRPKGGGRPLGLYERHASNQRLRMIRRLTHSTVRVPATRWFSDAVKRFGTQQFIRAQFLRAARERLQQFGYERG